MEKTEPNPSRSQQLEGAGLGFLIGFAGLLAFQLLGEVFVRLISIPVPGPVAGLLFMLVFLLLREQRRKKQSKHAKSNDSGSLLNASSLLLSHLSLLFVPAGVGIITHIDRIKDQWLSISIALIIASFITLFVTAWSLKILIRVMNKPEPE